MTSHKKIEGELEKKYVNGFKSGGNILDQTASKYKNKLFIIRFPLKWGVI